jgi:membrane-associated phospholipid phosphatase
MITALKTWLVGLVLTVAAVWFSYLWLDRPIAMWVRASFGGMRVPVKLIESPLASISLISACAFVICGLVAVSGCRFSRLGTTISMCVISTVATVLVKNELKFVFGRTWPETWGPGIISFVGNGAYGFHYFHYGRSFESFPSGHAAIVAAVLSVPGIMFQRLRIIAAICIILVDISLVMLNLHFLSDVIAGSFVGFSIGLFTISLWRASNSYLFGLTGLSSS